MQGLFGEIRKQLLEEAEPAYQKFSSSLLPGVERIIGVRLPKLRKIAKEIAKREDFLAYLKETQGIYFEEQMLQGLALGYAKLSLEEKLELADSYIKRIHCWSICDSFCTALKPKEIEKEKMWAFLQPYFFCANEYEVRFAVVMTLSHYVEEAYAEKVFEIFDQIKQKDYYAKMAIAWAVSIFYIQLPERTMQYLKHNQLDDFTYNKALQKITESLRIEKETKAMIRAMKRK